MTSTRFQTNTEPPTAAWSGRRVLVVGLGRFGGGLGVTRWLAGRGAQVTVTDQADREALIESVEALVELPVTLRLGGHDPQDLDSTDLVVVNPAVDKNKSAFFQRIVKKGVPWTTEMNLFCERCPATVIGVTGTFGKSTTCAMLQHVFEAACRDQRAPYRKVYLGGNIGRSLLGELDGMSDRDLVILEMSNAQLEDLPRIDWRPHVAVITNLFPHHLDRYGAFSDYIAAKLNVLGGVDRQRAVVTGPLHPQAEAALSAVLRHTPLVRESFLAPPIPGYELRVPGAHNQANAACACAVARIMGLDEGFVRETLRSFRGLEHRLEFVRTIDGVDYYNDSKSTAPPATVVALEAIARPAVAIVGGQRKGVPLTDCATALARWCRVVICLGESGPAFAEALLAHPRVCVHTVPDLSAAVNRARAEARSGEVVLFSPGAPSFDQYANFTQRGRHFVESVEKLN